MCESPRRRIAGPLFATRLSHESRHAAEDSEAASEAATPTSSEPPAPGARGPVADAGPLCSALARHSPASPADRSIVPVSELREAAIAYAEHGLEVFPLAVRGKLPLIS